MGGQLASAVIIKNDASSEPTKIFNSTALEKFQSPAERKGEDE